MKQPSLAPLRLSLQLLLELTQLIVPGDKATPATPTLTAEADGYFPEEGVVSSLKSIVDGTSVGSSPVDRCHDHDCPAALPLLSLDPSAGACRNSPSAILVEVCYYRATLLLLTLRMLTFLTLLKLDKEPDLRFTTKRESQTRLFFCAYN